MALNLHGEKRMETLLSVTMDRCSRLNLGAEYLRSPEIAFIDEGRIEIRLESNLLSDMIRCGMEWLLRLDERSSCNGTILEVSRENGRIRLVCDLLPVSPGGIPQP
jgi:hypothetical protein